MDIHGRLEYKCHHCSIITHTKREASKHARKHSGNPFFRITCPICKAVFASVWGWSRHLNVHGIGMECGPESAGLGSDTANEAVASTSQQKHDESETCQDVESTHEADASCNAEEGLVFDARKELASLVLRLRAKNVTESSCRDVLEAVHSFTSHGIAEYEKNKQDQSSPSASDSASGPDLQCLKTCDAFMRTDHLEAAALREFDSTQPEAVTIGRDENGSEETVQYVSLTSQLKACSEERNVTLVAMAHSDSAELRGPQDGSAHSYCDDETLLLAIYYDGFQVGNPLGNKAKQHALGAIYCSIVNTEYRGKIDEILFVLLFQEILLKKYSWEQILKPLLEEVRVLEAEGIVLNGKHFRVRLSVVLGDNLGIHTIAGFSANFAGGPMMCRFCHGTKEEIRTKTHEREFRLRTREDYDASIRVLEEENFEESMCKALGIKAACPFSGMASFHAAESFPPDLMHDVLEGVVPSTFSLVLGKMLSENVVDGAALNDATRNFPYSAVDTNRPGKILVDGTKGRYQVRRSKPTANEAWVLLRLLPLLLIYAGVAADSLGQCAEFSLIVRLIGIMQTLSSFVLYHGEINRTQQEIETFLADVMRLFPTFHLTPKHHYLVHYPSQLFKHGPLRRLWCMRFEAYHQVLKRTIANSRQRKNVCRSIALRHQVQVVAKNLESRTISSKERSVFKGSIPDGCERLIQGATLYRKVKLNGVEYQSCEALVLTDGMAEILCICGRGNSHSFLVRGLVATYDAVLCAFRVARTTNVQVVDYAALQETEPVGLYEVRNTLYAVPRHLLRNTDMTTYTAR
ncbi:uncharacterized protein LOC122368505 [Amphibalanus amphitrite]|uniref:uncharacterized protein LOC122368505 n=1 Tax=Amphibalanus amphitrite TaxID=1232801 RepID=UPI001C919C5A|nr:uncharacterized protein LOC122368505 [Amphibalanus amphitrite]